MRVLTPHELEIGMILVEDVKTPTGQILSTQGEAVTRQLINRMKLYRVEVACVEDAVDEEPVAEEPTIESVPLFQAPPFEAPKEEPKPEPVKQNHIKETKTAKQKVAESPEFMGFQLEYYKAIEILKGAFREALQENIPLDPERLLNAIRPLFQQRNTITELFDMLNNLRALDDTIYAHSINVALVARMLGRWLKVDRTTLDVITQAGLIHDIGKCLIPEEVLNKTGKLTDEEFDLIRSHPRLGYNAIKQYDIDSRIKKAVLQHHERSDGSGYPSHLEEENLDDVAMIIAIADVYDAMTAARSYRTPLCAFQVIQKFEDEGYAKYPTKLIMTFLRQIAATYQSNRVVLNDGTGCKIIMLNKNDLSRPVVRLDDNTCLDLAAHRHLSITAII